MLDLADNICHLFLSGRLIFQRRIIVRQAIYKKNVPFFLSWHKLISVWILDRYCVAGCPNQPPIVSLFPSACVPLSKHLGPPMLPKCLDLTDSVRPSSLSGEASPRHSLWCIFNMLQPGSTVLAVGAQIELKIYFQQDLNVASFVCLS